VESTTTNTNVSKNSSSTKSLNIKRFLPPINPIKNNVKDSLCQSIILTQNNEIEKIKEEYDDTDYNQKLTELFQRQSFERNINEFVYKLITCMFVSVEDAYQEFLQRFPTLQGGKLPKKPCRSRVATVPKSKARTQRSTSSSKTKTTTKPQSETKVNAGITRKSATKVKATTAK
jgi:hypothetical protein